MWLYVAGTPMRHADLRAILFDLDGVLVDSAGWHVAALDHALSAFGMRLTEAQHADLKGLPTVVKLERLGVPPLLRPMVAALKAARTADLVQAHCHPDYQKLMLLHALASADYRLACVSNAQRASVLTMLRQTRLAEFFELVLGNDEDWSPKPAPDLYLAAIARLGLEPETCVVVEDALPGVLAARTAGVRRVICVAGYAEVTLSLFVAEGLL